MNWRTTILAALVLTAAAFGQVPTPALSGGAGISGTLHYAVRFSQIMSLDTATSNDLSSNQQRIR